MDKSVIDKRDIYNILSDGKYILPLKFLKKRNINKVNDITSNLIIEFSMSEGVGVKKVSDFIELMTQIYILSDNKKELSFSVREIDFWFAPKEFKRVREYFKDINIRFVEEIDENILTIIPSVKGMSKKRIDNLMIRLKEYEEVKKHLKSSDYINECYEEQSPKRILFSLTNVHNKERVKEILHRRYEKGQTLECIGDEFGLSRERVRQLQVEGIDEVRDYLNAKKFIVSLKKYFKESEYCSLKQFHNLFNEDNKHYAGVILNNYNSLYLFNELELIYFEDNSKTLELIEQIIKRLPNKFFIIDYLDYLMIAFKEIGLININMNSIKKLLMANGYQLYGEYMTKSKLNAIDIMELIFNHYQIEPLKFNEDGLKRIKKLSKKHLDYSLEGNLRAFENRLRENANILLVDKLTFQHIKNASIDEEVVIKIGEMLEEHFENENIANASQIFMKNEDYLISNGIKTKYKMYNIISIYFGDYYKVGRGNTLEIYKNDCVEVQSKEEILKEYINSKGGIVHKEIVLNDLSWPVYKVEDTISKSKDILKLGEEISTLIYLEISEKEVKEIRRLVDKLLSKSGFTTGFLIYEKAKSEDELKGLLKRGNINRSDKIASIVKKLFKDIRGHINFIYNEKSVYKSIEEVISKGISGRVRRESLKEYMSSLGYRDMMTSMTINKVIDNGCFYEISREELVSSNTFKPSKEVIRAVISFIEKKFGEEDYLVLSNLNDFKELPNIEYEWSAHLIKSIACLNGYKGIERIYNDIRGEKIIIGRENGEIQSYDELLVYLLKNNYNGKMLEGKIYDFFAEYGVVKNHKDLIDKKIPYDLKVTGKIKVDEVGRVTLLA
ncbi:MAG: sigma factor-like helix-turn-helix DNA-binding protein [Clostridium sp.]